LISVYPPATTPMWPVSGECASEQLRVHETKAGARGALTHGKQRPRWSGRVSILAESRAEAKICRIAALLTQSPSSNRPRGPHGLLAVSARAIQMSSKEGVSDELPG
jgi:hypothetical protein